MNGEMYQLCRLTVAAKSALLGYSDFVYEPLGYENKINFTLLSQARCLIKRHTASNASQWYKYCVKKGLRDIKLMFPTDVEDRGILGFINTSQGYIMCYFKTGEITAFAPNWQYNSKLKKWDILYTEHLMLIPYVKPYIENNTDEFREVLIEIEDLAERIDCPEFAKIFEKALNILDGAEAPKPKPDLPKAAEKICRCSAPQIRRTFSELWGHGTTLPHIWRLKKGLTRNMKSCPQGF